MTVKQLIEKLSQEDPNRIVIMSRDSEGNSYCPLADFWVGSYRAYSSHSGDAGLGELTEEDRKAGYSDEDVVQGEPAIILSPVN